MIGMKELDDYFFGYPLSRTVFDMLRSYCVSPGTFELRVAKSQVTFRHQKNFLLGWIPAIYLMRKTAPLVMTVSYNSPDPSLRWKEIINVSLGRYTHHLELFTVDEVDAEVKNWIKKAWHEGKI